MKDIILFGAGRALSSCLDFCRALGGICVVEIWDHHPQMAEVVYGGERVPVCLPHPLEKKMPVYIIPVRFEREIRAQLRTETNLSDADVYSWENILDGYRQEMIFRYERSLDARLRACAAHMKQTKKLDVFNDDFADAYAPERMEESVSFDGAAGLWYTDWHGHRLYMKRGATQHEAAGYFRTIRCEQDGRSPHHYPLDFEAFPADVVLDCGAAEGFFALDAVGHAKEIYLFDNDDDWIAALQQTFANTGNTDVHIIRKLVGDFVDEEHVTIDSLHLSGRRILVKMDIEGAEREALHGMACTMERNNAIRILACAYHRHGDAEAIAAFLLHRRFDVRCSEGYMWFPCEPHVEAELRHALVIGERRRKHVYLWGAGQKLQEVFDCLRLEECVVDGIVDSHAANCRPFRSHDVQSPDILKMRPFDAVIVTAVRWEGVAKAYEDMGFPKEKLLCFWKDGIAEHPLFRKEMLRLHAMEREVRKWKARAENAPFEYAAKADVRVMDGVTLLKRILKEHCSLSRFGDGEFSTILQEGRPWFQEPDPQLAEMLRKVLEQPPANLLLAIADNYGNLEKYTETIADGIRSYQCENQHRARILGLLDQSHTYYDAYVTRPYLLYRDKRWSENIFALWKQLFAGRDILLVEGRFSRFGCGNDLLTGAASIQRILAPEKNAFLQYDSILDSIHRHANATDLVLISLGPTATVLAADVAKLGIQAIDIGQLDNEYDWYRMGAKDRVPIVGKMTAEVQWDREVEEIQDTAYESSIVDCCFRRNIHE